MIERLKVGESGTSAFRSLEPISGRLRWGGKLPLRRPAASLWSQRGEKEAVRGCRPNRSYRCDARYVRITCNQGLPHHDGMVWPLMGREATGSLCPVGWRADVNTFFLDVCDPLKTSASGLRADPVFLPRSHCDGSGPRSGEVDRP